MSGSEESATPAAGGNPAKGSGATKPHPWYRIWAEVAGAWAIAVALPIYSQIPSGPEALTSYGVRRPDLLVLVLVVSVLGPLIITLAELLLRRFLGDRIRLTAHAIVIAALLSLVLWQWLIERDFPDFARNLLPLLLACLIAWLYLRTELVRNFAQILSLAAIVVVVVFFLEYPVKNELMPHEKATATPSIEADIPVVMVVFDELPLAAIERPDGTIDPRFENLAMLARRATWYPDAMSVGEQTLRAMPSIMTGENPPTEAGWSPPPPGLAEYPDNICRIAADGGYEIHSYEPVSDFCERTWGLGSRVTATIARAIEMAPGIAPANLSRKAINRLRRPFDIPWTEYYGDRPAAFEAFIDDLPDSDRSLSLLHIALPHIDWMFSPDGSSYEHLRSPHANTLISPGTQGELDRDAQQMMLQLAYTDLMLGKLISRMKSTGIWDESLFIVTSDHGASFLVGENRRLVNSANAGWIVPVPLFIKYPGQSRGEVVRGTVDGRDIAPTVFATLGIEPPEGVAGHDLTGKRRLPDREAQDVSTAFAGITGIDLRTIGKSRSQAIAYMDRLFGRSFFAPGGRPDLLGKQPTGLKEIPAEPTDPALYRDVDLSSGRIPAYYEAKLGTGASPGGSVAISLNGRIAATATPWKSEGGWRVGVNLPTDDFQPGTNEIRVYGIGPGS